MTKLLEQALEAAGSFSPDAQDDIARVILRLASTDEEPPVTLSPGERTAIATSQEAAAGGEFGPMNRCAPRGANTAYEASVYPSGPY